MTPRPCWPKGWKMQHVATSRSMKRRALRKPSSRGSRKRDGAPGFESYSIRAFAPDEGDAECPVQSRRPDRRCAQIRVEPRWTDLAELFLERKLTEKVALDLLTKISASLTSDERLEALIKEASKRGTKVSSGPREITPMDGVVIKAGRGSVSLSVKKSGTSAEFASWLESNLEEIIKRSYTEFTDVNSEGDK